MSEDVPYWSWFRLIHHSHYTKYPGIPKMSEDVPYWSWFRVILYSYYTKYPGILKMSEDVPYWSWFRVILSLYTKYMYPWIPTHVGWPKIFHGREPHCKLFRSIILYMDEYNVFHIHVYM